MEFSYKKNDNKNLFASLEKQDLLNLSKSQNYIPLYKKFFELNTNNYNSINLNNPLSLKEIISKETENKFLGKVVTDSEIERNKEVYFKLSPLLDPIKYITGKYDISDNNLLNLPDFINPKNCHEKVNDPNNLSYVDGFFSYLTSQLLHNYGFIHGLDFYGSFLATKNEYIVNIKDEMEYLRDSKFFHKNKGKLYEFSGNQDFSMLDYDGRSFRPAIIVTEEIENDLSLCDISTITDLNIFAPYKDDKLEELEPDLLYEGILKAQSDKSSSCSSRSSNTDADEENDEDDNESSCESGTCSTASEDQLLIKIPQFPIQIISLEKCHRTFDYLLMHDELEGKELGSAIIQILMILITYQKVYSLTHNDLHTNNIMYIETEKQFLFYKYNNKYYKVPTYGRIFKIIDYGRAIYKFRGNVICSDSFHSKGDAATQYNFEPYFDESKQRIGPNFSFDLCRLGCSMFDFLVEDISKINEIQSPLEKIIIGWCLDDKGRNILYKNNGEERYPDFKLYKMIARTVHNHVPSNVLEENYFQLFTISKKKINKSHKILNIDNMPCL